MNSIELKQLNKKMEKLLSFLSEDKRRSENEIMVWISDCVALFSGLGVNSVIISNFIKFYKPEDTGAGLMNVTRIIGNFDKTGFEKTYRNSYQSYSAEIAFASAKSILSRKQEDKRLVHNWLIDSFEDGKYNGIKSSLILIETGYENKDSDSIIKNSLTLLECILDLDIALSEKKNLSYKLTELLSNETLRKNFGVSKEFVIALNDGRLIRNIKSVHKKKDINYDIPFLVAINNAYLVILLLEITLATGNFIS